MNVFIKTTIIVLVLFFQTEGKSQINKANQSSVDTIPLGGNAWVNEPAMITDNGLIKWTDPSSVVHLYFRVSVVQNYQISLRAKVLRGESEINVTSGNTHFDTRISNTNFTIINLGKLPVTKPGYIKIDIKGKSKTGPVYADISDLIVRHEKRDTGLVYVRQGSSFHFGRRGPSVHLRYPLPDTLKKDVQWFYNEINVPVGMDKIGSYFMADGFGEGYFGMQVNSDSERRVLFSVWSPFNTENPKDIPDSLRIVLLKKGTKVQANDFGKEGSGGQSYMRYSWQSGKTYAFLLGAHIDSIHQATEYTAYFKDVMANPWYLIASFKRPHTATNLTHLYSFLENFIPETGNETRMGMYKNQWVRDGKEQWHEVTDAEFTVDATAKGGYRKDYAGGAKDDYFFLRNDGFFNDFVMPNQVFKRKSSGVQPVINFHDLPQQ